MRVVQQVPFEVPCVCGQVATGFRQAAHQVMLCPRCGARQFILPASPLPPLHAESGQASPLARGRWRLQHWLLPLAAISMSVVGLAAVYVVFLAPWKKSEDITDRVERTAASRLEAARRFMAEGSFHLAVDELEGNVAVQRGDFLNERQQKEWAQLRAEARLFADLLAEPVEDLLQHAADTRPQEWAANFRHRYEGKAVIFQGEIRRGADGRALLAYRLPGAARLVVDELNLFCGLQLEHPATWVFGARLASASLEPPGPKWVIRFVPDSGVLLTEAEAAALCCPALATPEARQVLDRQANQLRESAP
jgi:hypothetical protein